MKHEDRYVWLDFVRGLSALLVVLMHLRHYVMVEYHDLVQPTLLMKLIYFISSLGHVAVMVFFVMSGFFVGGSILGKGRDFSWLDYMIARLARLWVVLIPALGLTMIVDCYLMPASYTLLQENINGHSITVLLGNLFFLQNVFVSEYGSNQPLWSLANEFWYYMIFPLAFFTIDFISKDSSILQRTATGLATILIFFVMSNSMRLGLLIWLMGVLVYCFDKGENATISSSMQNIKLLVGFLLFILMVIFNKQGVSTGNTINYRDVAVGFGFSIFLILTAKMKVPQFCRATFLKFSHGLSEISYSLYLSHFPLAMLIGKYFYSNTRLMPSLTAYAQLLVWLIAIVIFAVVFWWAFERHTPIC